MEIWCANCNVVVGDCRIEFMLRDTVDGKLLPTYFRAGPGLK